MPSKKPTKKPAPKAKAPAKPAKSAKPAAKAGMKPLSGGMKPINTAKPTVAVVPSSPPPPTKKHPNRVPPPPIGKNAPRPMPKKEPVEEKGKKTPKIDYATALSVAAVAVQQKADSSGYVMVNGRRVRMLSGKNVPTTKKSSKAAEAAAKAKAAEEAIDVSEIRTKLGAKELEGYRELLLRSRMELVGRVDSLEDEALRSSGGNLSNMPLHMADVGTDTFDQDFNIGMAQAARGIVQEIDEALKRIADRTYGMCMLTGKPIPKGRLAAMPWAKYTVEAARQVEKSRPRPS